MLCIVGVYLLIWQYNFFLQLPIADSPIADSHNFLPLISVGSSTFFSPAISFSFIISPFFPFPSCQGLAATWVNWITFSATYIHNHMYIHNLSITIFFPVNIGEQSHGIKPWTNLQNFACHFFPQGWVTRGAFAKEPRSTCHSPTWRIEVY